METEEKNGNSLATPAAIVIAGLVIAGAVYFKDGKLPAGQNANQPAAVGASLEKLEPINSNDRQRGDKQASIQLIEYSDLECPFCKAFHQAMNRLMSKYNVNDQKTLVWAYRHFPLDSIHPKADKEAEAAECVREQKGNDGFWQYVDKIFSITPSNNQLDPAELPRLAGELKVDLAKFNDCLATGKYASLVEKQFQNGLAIGVDGTPAVIILTADGKKFMPFREEMPADLDSNTKNLVTDLFAIYQEEIDKLRAAVGENQ